MIGGVQIVPKAPPIICGVFDYAHTLRNENASLAGSAILTFRGLENQTQKIVKLGAEERMFGALLDDVTPDSFVLLHYVPHGYGKRGLSFELVKSIELLKSKKKLNRLITVFHELYATGPLWRSSFWLSGVQKALAKRLARLSDVCVSTTTYGLEHLQSWTPNPCFLMPVFSNVGEEIAIVPIAARERNAVIFGGREQKSAVYTRLAKQSGHLSQAFPYLERILDVGPEYGVPREVQGLLVNKLGVLPKEEVADVLRNSVLGLSAYPKFAIEKSGIIAAYSAYGVPTILLSADDNIHSNMKESQLFVPNNENVKKLEELQCFSDKLFRWYSNHSLSATSAQYERLIQAGR